MPTEETVSLSWSDGEEAVDIVTSWLTRHRQTQPGPASLHQGEGATDQGNHGNVRKSLFEFLTEFISFVSGSPIDVECKVDLLDVFSWYDSDLVEHACYDSGGIS